LTGESVPTYLPGHFGILPTYLPRDWFLPNELVEPLVSQCSILLGLSYMEAQVGRK
jgi:hypothetical protein